jgi:hypothetical protein
LEEHENVVKGARFSRIKERKWRKWRETRMKRKSGGSGEGDGCTAGRYGKESGDPGS